MFNILSQVQHDPHDSTVLSEFKMSKAISIIHNLEPKGRDIGKWNVMLLVVELVDNLLVSVLFIL